MDDYGCVDDGGGGGRGKCVGEVGDVGSDGHCRLRSRGVRRARDGKSASAEYEEEQRMRAAVRKEKNRVAAAASRDRKNSYINSLEEALGILGADKDALRARVSIVVDQVYICKQVIKVLREELCEDKDPERLEAMRRVSDAASASACITTKLSHVSKEAEDYDAIDRRDAAKRAEFVSGWLYRIAAQRKAACTELENAEGALLPIIPERARKYYSASDSASSPTSHHQPQQPIQQCLPKSRGDEGGDDSDDQDDDNDDSDDIDVDDKDDGGAAARRRALEKVASCKATIESLDGIASEIRSRGASGIVSRLISRRASYDAIAKAERIALLQSDAARLRAEEIILSKFGPKSPLAARHAKRVASLALELERAASKLSESSPPPSSSPTALTYYCAFPLGCNQKASSVSMESLCADALKNVGFGDDDDGGDCVENDSQFQADHKRGYASLAKDFYDDDDSVGDLALDDPLPLFKKGRI